jgi:hypothetical protein
MTDRAGIPGIRIVFGTSGD